MQNPHYTDPRIAGYMHDTFGVNFIENFDISKMFIEDRLSRSTRRCKLHLRDESLHLLEPRAGDIWISNGSWNLVLKVRDDIFDYAAYDGGWGWARMSLVGDSAALYARIIQRDGKPFHWPEYDS